ncbi:TylF/MycF/NovP-related O-methyltransferase [Lysinibacillus fusiformis]|uniref:TylF/MycF/NovP-related O-methyltransferase n=1 Tax=Lysinibacillus fusiformis TaxID=28031 RepID=UPI003AAEC4E0
MKKKIIFGTGRIAESVIQNITMEDIYAFIDNDKKKSKGFFHDLQIFSPKECMEQIDLKDFIILVASSQYEDISKQLISMDLVEGIHFFDALTLLSVAQIRELLNIDMDIEDEFIELYIKVKNYSMTSIDRLYSLYQSVKYVIANEVQGDFVECGVWRGGSSMMVMETLRKLGVTDRDVYLYDTFEGMSEPSDSDIDFCGNRAEQKWLQSQSSSVNLWCYASLDDVKSNIEKTSYPMDKIHFVKGKVEETLTESLPEKLCLLRLDTDWYESTYQELLHLYPLLSLNGVLIIDDYGHWQGARKAVNDYFKKYNVKMLLNKIDFTGRLGLKTHD